MLVIGCGHVTSFVTRQQAQGDIRDVGRRLDGISVEFEHVNEALVKGPVCCSARPPTNGMVKDERSPEVDSNSVGVTGS